MSRKKEVRQYLWKTLEMARMQLYLGLYGAGVVICAVVMYLSTKSWPAAAAMLIVFLPYLIFFLVRTLKILAKPESYCFYQAKLEHPHHSPLIKNRFYFTVKLEEEGEVPLFVDTHAIFEGYSMMGLQMESCLNKTVTIAYNPDTEMVVVAG